MADNTIKNKIILEGEAQYKRAMADITRALKENKSAVKAAAAEFDNSADSMQAQYRLGDALERQYNQQSNALDLMCEQLDKVESAYGTNSREAVDLRTKINNMRTETAKTETQLKSFRNGLDGVSDAAADGSGAVADMAESVDAIGDKAQGAQSDVKTLAEEIAGAVGKKAIEFSIGAKAFDLIKDGVKGAVKWGFEEGLDNQVEHGLFLSGAGDPALAAAREAVQGALDKVWAGRYDGKETQAAVEAVDTTMDNASLTTPDRVEHVTNMALTHQNRWGQSVQEQMNRADAMRKTFGTDWETTFDLMTAGFQDSHDGGEMMLKVVDENAQMFKQLGYDADDMFSVIIAATNSEELGKDSNLNKGMTQLYTTVTSGSKEAEETLKALGVEAMDWPSKLQEGGETAAAAMQQLLTSLLSIEDATKRDELGKALFGDKVWTQTGGDIAQALLDGYNQTIAAEGKTDFAMNALLDNLPDAAAQAKERVAQTIGEITQPFVEAGTDALQAFNAGFDAGGLGAGIKAGLSTLGDEVGSIVGTALDDAGTALNEKIEGIASDISTSVEQIVAPVDEKLGEISSGISESFYSGAEASTDTAAADATAKRWIDTLTGSVDAEAGKQEPSEAVKGMLEGLLPDTTVLDASMKAYAESHKAAVVAQMETVYGQDATDEDYQAWQRFQQAMIDSAYDDTVKSAGNLGDDAAMETVKAVDDAQPDMLDAGDELGGAGVVGAKAGLLAMPEAGRQGAAGLTGGLRTAVASSYAAGYDAGKAFERGFKVAQDQHSPSRVMQDAGELSMDGLMLSFDEGESRVYAAGEALGQALTDGYGSAQGGAFGAGYAQAGGAIESPSELVDAMLEALERVVVYLDKEPCGRLMAPGVSREISSQAGRTMAGRFSSVKGW